jgi:hypothetical protein
MSLGSLGLSHKSGAHTEIAALGTRYLSDPARKTVSAGDKIPH